MKWFPHFSGHNRLSVSCSVQLPRCSPSSGPEQLWSIAPPPFTRVCPQLAVTEKPAGKGQGADANGGVSGTVKSRGEGSALGQGPDFWTFQGHHGWVWDL